LPNLASHERGVELMAATALATMSEAELLSNVIEMAELLKWRCVHFRPGMNRRGHWATAMSGTQAAGWPDLTLCRDRLIAVELKSDKGRLTPAQLDWAAALTNAGVEYFCFRPADWLDGTIQKVLQHPYPTNERASQ
jgi:hypothetical protein